MLGTSVVGLMVGCWLSLCLLDLAPGVLVEEFADYQADLNGIVEGLYTKIVVLVLCLSAFLMLLRVDSSPLPGRLPDFFWFCNGSRFAFVAIVLMQY